MKTLLLIFFSFTTKNIMLDKDSMIYLSPKIEEVLKVEGNLIYDFLINKKGIFFTSGNKVYHNEKLIYSTEEENIFALTSDGENLYLGLSPESTILKMKNDKIVENYKIPAANILKMVYQEKKFFIATSYPTLIYQLEKKQILCEIPDENISALTYEKETLYIGTSPKGYLYQLPITNKKELKLLFDCEEEEIKDIVIKDNFIYFITNSNQKLPTLYFFDKIKKEQKEIFSFPCSTLFSLAIKNDTLLVCGSSNTLYKIIPEKNYFAIYGFDGEILTKIFLYNNETYLSTGYPAKIYKLRNEISNEGDYLSPIIDLKFISKFGKMEIVSDLPLFASYEVYTRSGGNNLVDETWSKFSLLENGRIKSPENRYFQYLIRLKKEKGEKSPIIKKVRYFYKNINQPPKIKTIKVSPDTENPKIKIIKYEVSDPNDDSLLYFLYYQIKGDKNWFLLAKEIKENEYKLDGKILPDGFYQIKLIASDEITQPKREALKDSIISDEFLIDNTSPKLFSFNKEKIKDGYKIRIKVADSLASIKGFYYSIDDEKEEKISPIDEIFDDKEEEFLLEVKKEKFLLNIRFFDEYLNEKRYNWLIK